MMRIYELTNLQASRVEWLYCLLWSQHCLQPQPLLYVNRAQQNLQQAGTSTVHPHLTNMQVRIRGSHQQPLLYMPNCGEEIKPVKLYSSIYIQIHNFLYNIYLYYRYWNIYFVAMLVSVYKLTSKEAVSIVAEAK